MAKRTVEVLLKAKDQTKQGTDSAGKNFNKLEKDIGVSAKSVAAFGAAAVAAFAAATAAAYKFLSATAHMEDQLAKAAKRAQVDVQTYGEWSFVMQRAGGSASTFEKAIQALQKQMGSAARGSIDVVEAFDDMEVAFANSDGTLRDSAETFSEIVDVLSEMEDESKRAYLAQTLLGRGGKSLIPIFNESAESLQAQKDLYIELGGAAITAAAETGEAWVDAELHIKTAKDGIRASFLSAFGPSVIELMEEFAKGLRELGRLIENMPVADDKGWVTFFRDLGKWAGTATALVSSAFNALSLIGNWKIKEEGATKALWEDLNKLNSELERYLAVLYDVGDSPVLLSDLQVDPSTLGPYKPEVEIEIDVGDIEAQTRAELEALARSLKVSTTEPVLDTESMEFIDVPIATDKLISAVTAAWVASEKAAADAAAKAAQVAALAYSESAQMALQQMAESLNVATTKTVFDPIFGQMTDVPLKFEELARAVAAAWNKGMEDSDFIGPLQDNIDEVTDSIDDTVDAADTLGTSLATAAGTGAFDLMAGDAIDLGKILIGSVVKALQQIIIKLLVIKAIKAFSSVPFLADGGKVPGAAKGGKIPRAAYGFNVPDSPNRGADSRMIFAQPGEEVINRQLSQRLNRFITAQESAAYASPYGSGAAVGGSQTVVLNVGLPETQAGLQRLVDTVQEANQSGGAI